MPQTYVRRYGPFHVFRVFCFPVPKIGQGNQWPRRLLSLNDGMESYIYVLATVLFCELGKFGGQISQRFLALDELVRQM